MVRRLEFAADVDFENSVVKGITTPTLTRLGANSKIIVGCGALSSSDRYSLILREARES